MDSEKELERARESEGKRAKVRGTYIEGGRGREIEREREREMGSEKEREKARGGERERKSARGGEQERDARIETTQCCIMGWYYN